MTTFRIVIRVTTTEDFEFKVEANTREEARGKSLASLHLVDFTTSGDPSAFIPRIRQTKEERFVSTKAITNPPDKRD